ncbi:unnamed protein product [Brassica oleracea]
MPFLDPCWIPRLCRRAICQKTNRNLTITCSSSLDEPSSPPIRVPSSSTPKARFISRQKQSVSVRQLQRPLSKLSTILCPVLLVRVEEQPNGCCVKLLSCKVYLRCFSYAASMVNRVSCDSTQEGSSEQRITSDAVIEVNIEVPFAFRVFPVGAIEATGTQVLDQILRLMLPRFLSQLSKDYQAWASGDTSRQPLGTGEI